MIRTCYSWIYTLLLLSRYNPPRFIELMMLATALIMLITYMFTSAIPYLVLGLSFVIGASASILVRETIEPTPQTRVTKTAALLLIIISISLFIADFLNIFINFT